MKLFSCSSYEVCKLYCKPCATELDGTPCAVKAARTVWSRGKVGDYIKGLPMAIRLQVSGHEAAHGWRRRCSGGHHPHSSAVWSVRLRAAGGVSRLYIRNRSILAVDNSPLIRSALRYESPPISERRCLMQFLTHIIFLLNLLKTLINHFS